MVQYSWIFLYHGEILELEWLPQIRGIKKKHLTEVKIPQIWGKIIWGRINRVWSPSLDDWLMVYWTWSDQLICTVKSSSHIDVDVQISGFEQVRACLFISTGKLQSVVKLFVIFIPVRLNRLHISCPESIPSKSDLLSTDVEHHCTDNVDVQVLDIHVVHPDHGPLNKWSTLFSK